jgi:hypothetical protein
MLGPGDQRVVDDIAAHGWHCTLVPEDEEGPGFAYSIGLGDTLGAPELIVLGLKHKLMHTMIWRAFHQIKEGSKIEANARYLELIGDFPCIMKPVHPSWHRDYFGYALWYYRCRNKLAEFQAFQIFWPGKLNGLFPWEDGADEYVGWCQPRLYFPKPEASRA